MTLTPTEYKFTYQQMAEMLVKVAGIHEGKWTIGLTFETTISNVGQTPDSALPGVIVRATNAVLSRVEVGATTPALLVIDAAEVNPANKMTFQ